MPRSIKKGPFIDLHLEKKVLEAVEANNSVQSKHGLVVR